MRRLALPKPPLPLGTAGIEWSWRESISDWITVAELTGETKERHTTSLAAAQGQFGRCHHMVMAVMAAIQAWS